MGRNFTDIVCFCVLAINKREVGAFSPEMIWNLFELWMSQLSANEEPVILHTSCQMWTFVHDERGSLSIPGSLFLIGLWVECRSLILGEIPVGKTICLGWKASANWKAEQGICF